jgi:syntaxin 1A
MAKDKLAALLAAQDSDSDPDDAPFVVSEVAPMDAFFVEMQTVHETIARLEACVEQVKEIHDAILCAPQTDPKTTHQLEDLTAEIKDAATRLRLKLNTIGPEDGEDETSARIRMTQQVTLTKRLVDVMTEFNRAQVDYGESCKARLQRQLEIAGKQTTDEELEEILQKENFSVFVGDIVTETSQERQRVQEIEARHADLVKLERSIQELHGMFVDMAMLVEGQGELLDSIEYHVGLTQDLVEEAQADLRKAKVWKEAAKKKQIMILLCLVLAAIIGILVLLAVFLP